MAGESQTYSSEAEMLRNTRLLNHLTDQANAPLPAQVSKTGLPDPTYDCQWKYMYSAV